MFNTNGPDACADGATDYAEIRGCLEPSEVVEAIPGEGFSVGSNSDIRQVSGSETHSHFCPGLKYSYLQIRLSVIVS